MEDKCVKVSTKSAAVVSLHFSPAHASHLLAYGKLLRELGFAVSFVLDKIYLGLADFNAIAPVISASTFTGLPGGQDFDIAVFYNAAIRNHSVAARMRVRGTSVLYVFHEPESIWNLFSEGWKQIAKFPVATYFSIAMLRQSSTVLVPSTCARTLYERYFQKYNKNVHTLPLLLDDEIAASCFEKSRHRRRFFSFLGNASKGHGFDAFVAFAKYAIKSGSSIPFAIATKADLRSVLLADQELSRYAQEGRIVIQHGRVLTNEEINQYYLQSFCVWNVYRRSTQSGVLPRAFMAGSPVLARRIGSFPEFVQEGITGEFVDSPDDPGPILEAAKKMRERSSTYVNECRKRFLETFYYKANGNKLASILGSAYSRDDSLRIAKSILRQAMTDGALVERL